MPVDVGWWRLGLSLMIGGMASVGVSYINNVGMSSWKGVLTESTRIEIPIVTLILETKYTKMAFRSVDAKISFIIYSMLSSHSVAIVPHLYLTPGMRIHLIHREVYSYFLQIFVRVWL